MKRSVWTVGLILFLLGGLALAATADPAKAGPPRQVTYATPTALPDGRVLYKVQAGDTCLRIELLTGVKIQELQRLNNLDQNCTLKQGVDLLLAVITPTVTPTFNPGATATPLLPTATPRLGTGEICVVLFADLNGNAVRETTEPPILGGAVSLADRSGVVSLTGTTTDNDAAPLCFKDVPEGEYNLSMAIPDGYNPTTTNNRPLKLIAGNRSLVDFGAQISGRPQTPSAAGGSRSPLLLIVGLVLLLGGAGLGVYFRLTRKN